MDEHIQEGADKKDKFRYIFIHRLRGTETGVTLGPLTKRGGIHHIKPSTWSLNDGHEGASRRGLRNRMKIQQVRQLPTAPLSSASISSRYSFRARTSGK